MSALGTTWTTETRNRIREIQDGLLSVADLAKSANADAAATEMLLHPYRELLEQVFERDLPLAKLRDESDLLLHVHGVAANGPTPRVSTLTRLLSSTRDHVTRIAKQIGSIDSVRVPMALDMTFVGVAGGSLFVGFSVDQRDGADFTKQAIRAIADTSFFLSEEKTVHDLASAIDDPETRDMALSAVRQLAPSGQIGISDIEILGRQVNHESSLTTDTRRTARQLLAQRASKEAPVEYVGTVRELDLDLARFEIRNVEGHPEAIRCAHELGEDEVRQYFNRRVRVKGTPEYYRKTKSVRLLWVDEIEALDP
jgi:hypothetical protein